MKVLVTGSQGQLARSLAERAAAHPGLDLILVGRPEVDLETAGSATAVILAAQPDVVINAAAYTAVDQAEDEPDRAFRINAAGAEEVAAAAAEVGAGVVQISTDYVFDGQSAEPYDEAAPVNPLGVYGRSKLAGEGAVRSANAKHIIIRTAWVYSPFGRNFLKSIMAAATQRDILTVVDDQHGSPTSALDLADGLLAMLATGEGWGSTYHLAGSGSASWCEFAAAITNVCAEIGLPAAKVQPISTEDWPTRAVRPRNSVLDCSKFKRDFGFVMPEWRGAAEQTIRRLARADPS